jgi:hypothetical protein
MYSVLQMTIDSEVQTSDIAGLRLAIPKTTQIGNLLAITIAESKNLADHVNALEAFLQTFPEICNLANTRQVKLNLDIAIYVSEHIGLAVKELTFAVDLLEVLASRKIALTVSVYPMF